MENLIYNELLIRGYSVDVGMVEYNTKNGEGISQRLQLEVDFVASRGYETLYIQSAYSVETEDKLEQEIRPLKYVRNSFKKILIIKDDILPFIDEWGIWHLSLQDFLLGQDKISV